MPTLPAVDQGSERRWTFVRPYTPEWAEAGNRHPRRRDRRFGARTRRGQTCRHLASGLDDRALQGFFYVCRSIYIINALLGSIGAKGGLPFANKPEDVGRKGLKKLVDLFPKPAEKRADGVGWRYPHFDAGPGLLHLAFKAMETDDPYPAEGLHRLSARSSHGLSRSGGAEEVFEKLDLLVSVTFSWSDTAWFSDVVLPLLLIWNGRASSPARMG